MRLAVVGLGAAGAHAARQLHLARPEALGLFDIDQSRTQQVLSDLGAPEATLGTTTADGADVVVLATPAGTHADLAQPLVAAGRHVVSLSDHPGDVAGLLSLHDQAGAAGCSVIVGAGFAPGMSCLLARHAAEALDVVEFVSVAKSGTGGPACAREHHRAMKHAGHEFHQGEWVMRAGGSGRELIWFPDPVGALDCYRGDLPSPLLLQRVFPEATRLTSRVSATRRDRLTSRLPMLRPPHADGGPGAIRVEVRGRCSGRVETLIYGVADHPSRASGTVAAVAALDLADGNRPFGAFGLAEHPDHLALLHELRRRGIRAETYEGGRLL